MVIAGSEATVFRDLLLSCCNSLRDEGMNKVFVDGVKFHLEIFRELGMRVCCVSILDSG